MRRPFGLIVPLLGTCAVLPVGLLLLLGDRMVMPPMWVHFYGVGVSALVATAAAVLLTTIGAGEQDARTVIVGGGFTLMAALLAVHGLATPGMVLGPNGLIAVTGAATLPVGAAVMTLAALPGFVGPKAIPRVLAVEAALGVAIVAFTAVGALVPSIVPGVPAPRSGAAIALFVVGLALYGALAVRAMNTFLLTRRAADLAVVVGIVLLACALYGALFLSFMDLGWWLGHGNGSAPPPEYQQITFRTGSIGNARFTPDGSVVYSASWDGGDTQLYMARTDDPGARELGLKDAELLAVSKSGELAIRLKTAGYGGYAKSGTMARVPLSGGTPREVLENVQDADWAPNGDSMAVVRYVPENSHWRLEYPIGKVLFDAGNGLRGDEIQPFSKRAQAGEHQQPLSGSDHDNNSERQDQALQHRHGAVLQFGKRGREITCAVPESVSRNASTASISCAVRSADS